MGETAFVHVAGECQGNVTACRFTRQGRNPTSQTRYLYAAITSMTALGNGFSRFKGGPELSL